MVSTKYDIAQADKAINILAMITYRGFFCFRQKTVANKGKQ
jgi:hypothetical protein